MRKLGRAIYRSIFWTYERATWQYDVMVALILCFIFLTPRAWFNDRPATPLPASDIVLLLSDPMYKVYQVRATLMQANVGGSVAKSAESLLETHTGKSVEVIRVEPSLKDSTGQVMNYAVWVREQVVF